MIDILYRSIRDKKLNNLENFRKGVWINASGPDKKEIENILNMTKVQIDLIQDALDEYEVPRLEIEKGAAYIFTRVPTKKSNVTQTLPLLVVVGEDFVLTVAKEKLEVVEKFLKKGEDIFTTQKAKLFLALMAAINREYNRYLIEINKSVRTLRFQMNKIKVGDIAKFVDLEKVLNDFLSALIPTTTALENITSRRRLPYYESDLDMIEDLSVDFEQQIALTKSILKHVVNIRDAYSNIMTHDLNRVMKILTALTIILTIPTMVFSFYGMNVSLPFDGTPISYLYITIGTVMVSSVLLVVFIRNRWL